MKRFDLFEVPYGDGTLFNVQMQPTTDGGWVQWDDVEKLAKHRGAFTAEEIIEIANETSDSLGNLYRLDFIERIKQESDSGSSKLKCPPCVNHGACNAAGRCIKETKAQGMHTIEAMVERFLNWKLPHSVKPDAAAMDQDWPHRTGTNLLTATEARQMIEHILKP